MGEMQRLREKTVKLQIDQNNRKPDRIDGEDGESAKDNESELQRLKDKIAKLESEKKNLEKERKKQEKSRIEEVGKLGEDVKRLNEEVVMLKADEKKEEEKNENQADDQRTEQTKDFVANHSKSTSTDETTYLREERRNQTREHSSQTTDLNTFTSCQGKILEEETDGRRSSKGSEGKLEDVSLADEVRTDEKVHFTFQFLRRSIYYFLTDKENSGYHLRCMERLLEFTDGERVPLRLPEAQRLNPFGNNVIEVFLQIMQ